MKIKNIKSLVERLPEKRQPASHSYYPVNIGYNQAIDKVFNTVLPDCNKYVEVNVEKFTDLIGNTIDEETGMCIRDFVKWDMINHIAKAIQEAILLEYKKGE